MTIMFEKVSSGHPNFIIPMSRDFRLKFCVVSDPLYEFYNTIFFPRKFKFLL